ncbi:MAG: alpha-L-rhamnosidase-related protein [Planctomycetota bacterium]|jgi:hypothetical protein
MGKAERGISEFGLLVILVVFTLVITGCNNVTITGPKQTANSSPSDFWKAPSLIEYKNNEIPVKSLYSYLNGGDFVAEKIAESPDPLIQYRWHNVKADDDLQVYHLRPISVSTTSPQSFENLDSLKGPKSRIMVKGTGSIMLDFGIESAAWLEFDSPNLSGAVTMSISEYNQPAILNAYAQTLIKTKKPVKHGNTYRLELNSLLYEGVRFGWIHIDSFDKPWHIENVRLVCQIKPTNYTGSFSCSDPMLTRIWYVGAYSVKLNLLKDYIGAILMERSDRHSWTGDAHTSQAASLVAFGNFDFIKHNLERTAVISNAIKTYPLYWILSVLDYYYYTGDSKTLENYVSNIETKLQNGLKIYGTNPYLRFVGWDERVGAGFEESSCTESQNVYKMLFIQTCKQFSSAMQMLGRDDLQKKYAQIANEKIDQLKKNPNWHLGFGIHACSDAINAGLADESEQRQMFVREYSNPLHRISYSPFNQYFIINSMARMKKFDQALASINDCWGGQIELGATTFWEVFRPQWKDFMCNNGPVPNCPCGYTSLCHPWSSGVTKWLTEEVLGIKPISPGFKNYQIIPNLGRTLTKVKGNVKTPHGQIYASFDVSKGLCKIESPPGTTGDFAIPKVEKTIKEIFINEKLVWDGSYNPISGIGGAKEDKDFVYFNSVMPGKYLVKVYYQGQTPAFNEEQQPYAATFIREDSQTSGNWAGTYGKDGHILFSCFGQKRHLELLPEYVSSINFIDSAIGAAGHIHWASDTSDPRAPFISKNNNRRAVGAISTQNPTPCFQTTAFDIKLNKEHNYQLALYFVDWDRQKRNLVVEMFDYETKNLIAPLKKVSDFGKGKYLVYVYDKSVRLRINHIRGGDAVLSAIFFDKVPE